MIQLRAYQQRTNQAILDALKKYKNVIAYQPQGSGKSWNIAFMAFGAASKGNKTLILTHREEILKQNIRKMNNLGLDVQMISAQTKAIRKANIYCAMTQTLASRCKNLEEWREWMLTIDFLIVDEVHRGEHDALYPYLRENVWKVAMSATILRSGTMNQLGKYYDTIVCATKPKEIIDNGWLTPSKNYAFTAPKIDTVEIDRRTGDYVQQQLQKVFKNPARYAGIIENYQRICPHTKAMVFTTGSAHCVELCIAFNEAGIKAKYLLSKSMPKTDAQYSGKRDVILKELEDGVFDVLLSVSMLDTGVDLPCLETAILDFSTKSYTKYCQCVGRPARLFEGKKWFNVLDFGENIKSFGIYEAEPVMSLWHNTGGTGVPLTKECPTTKQDVNGKNGCGRLIPISSIDCPYCKYHFATDKEIYEVELQEVIAKEQEEGMTIPVWVAKKMLEGKNANWILFNICARNADSPKKAFMEAIKYIRTKEGKTISPQYWYFFKKNILKGKLKPK